MQFNTYNFCIFYLYQICLLYTHIYKSQERGISPLERETLLNYELLYDIKS